MAAHQAPLYLGFSRQEHWSGLPFPSPMHESEKWKWSRSVVSDSMWPHGLQPTRLLHPWDFPGKSTGVGCHRLLCYIILLADIAVYTFGVIPKNSLPKLIQGKFPLCCLLGVLIHFELILCVVFNSGPIYSSCGYWVSISLESILS